MVEESGTQYYAVLKGRSTMLNIKKICEQTGWTKEDIANEYNISLDLLEKYESGKEQIPQQLKMQLIEDTGLSDAELSGEKKTPFGIILLWVTDCFFPS